MSHSMTAFARLTRDTSWGELTWELRSVNHRFFEPSVRLPDELRALDPQVRARLSARLSRGKLDCSLRYVPKPEAGGLRIDEVLLDQLLAAARVIAQRLDPPSFMTVGELLRWPGLLRAAEPDLDALSSAALDLLEHTLERLVSARAAEGAHLQALILQRCERLAAAIAAVQIRLPEVQAAQRQRLHARCLEAQLELDPNRLEQELLLWAQRSDVAEELERMLGHLTALRAALTGSEPSGRRLDFLLQELHREANTLAAKANDLALTRAAVEMKVLIEQMREQAQNLE